MSKSRDYFNYHLNAKYNLARFPKFVYTPKVVNEEKVLCAHIVNYSKFFSQNNNRQACVSIYSRLEQTDYWHLPQPLQQELLAFTQLLETQNLIKYSTDIHKLTLEQHQTISKKNELLFASIQEEITEQNILEQLGC